MGVVQNSIDIEKNVAKIMALAAEIGDENSGIIKDIGDLQEDLSIKTTTYSAKAEAIETVTRAQIVSSGNVHTCRLDFTVGEANISGWTADLISFADLDLYCTDIVVGIRDASDPTKSSIQTVLLNKLIDHVGLTSSFVFLANHRYVIAFTYVNNT